MSDTATTTRISPELLRQLHYGDEAALPLEQACQMAKPKLGLLSPELRPVIQSRLDKSCRDGLRLMFVFLVKRAQGQFVQLVKDNQSIRKRLTVGQIEFLQLPLTTETINRRGHKGGAKGSYIDRLIELFELINAIDSMPDMQHKAERKRHQSAKRTKRRKVINQDQKFANKAAERRDSRRLAAMVNGNGF